MLAGFAIFGISLYLYALPAMFEAPPPGAIPSWNQERVKDRLRGKVGWFFAGSMLTAAAIGWRWLSPPEP